MSTTREIPKWVRVVVPGVVLLTWIVLGSIGGPYFGRISEVASNDQSTFLPASAESTRVNQEVEKFRNEQTIPAIVVFSDNGKKLDDADLSRISDASSKVAELPDVEGEASPPIESDDGKAALVVVNVRDDVEYREFVPELRNTLKESNIGVDFQITGPVGFLDDLAKAFAGIDGLLLAVALAVVFVILLAVYRSPVLPFLVLFNSLFALSVAILAVFYLAKAGVVTLNGQVQGILFILVIGAATDYALLFVARYREELTRHAQVYRAILEAWRRSLEPILAAGGTVTAGLLCLLLSDLTSNKALGPVGAIGIGFSIVSALTLLPCLLLVWGRKAFWPRIPAYNKSIKNLAVPRTGLWPRIAQFVSRHDRAVWGMTALVLLAGCVGVLQLRADGVPQSEFILGESEARAGQQRIDQHFPGGSGTPAYIVVPASQMGSVVDVLDSDSGVASVAARAEGSDSGTKPVGESEATLKRKIEDSVRTELEVQKADIRTKIEQQTAGAPSFVVDQVYEQAVSNIPDVATVTASAYPFKDAKTKVLNGEVLLEATLEYNADSDEALDTITRLRDNLHAVDANIRVGGTSAVQLDTVTSASHDRMVVIPAVLAVITVILMILLRSILAPVLLLITTVVSFGTALGVSALLFNHVWQFPGADPSVVLYGFIFLVALGIDYNIFLMTRVREESLRIGTRRGVLAGLVVTGGVITSAGIVLAATFAALAVIPILFLVQLAFIVAFGVLVDTIIVRSLLVPALVHDMGRIVWWPAKRYKN